MAWTAPKTDFASGNILTAAQMNDIGNNLAEFSELFTTFNTWTTTVTQSGTVTHTVNYARYVQIGRLVIANCYLTITGTGTGNNVITVNLPVTASSSLTVGSVIGEGQVIDGNVDNYVMAVIVQTSTTLAWRRTSAAGQQAGQSPNFALANNDILMASLMYEAATSA